MGLCYHNATLDVIPHTNFGMPEPYLKLSLYMRARFISVACRHYTSERNAEPPELLSNGQ
jgi:hypothetical protein